MMYKIIMSNVTSVWSTDRKTWKGLRAARFTPYLITAWGDPQPTRQSLYQELVIEYPAMKSTVLTKVSYTYFLNCKSLFAIR